MAAGLIALRNGAHAAAEAMLSVKARMRPALDANLSILATIGSNAPFVGLMGTVLGIIKAAHELTAERPEQPERGNVRRVRGLGGDGRRPVRRHSGGRGLQFVSTYACGSGLPRLDSLAHLILSTARANANRRPATAATPATGTPTRVA